MATVEPSADKETALSFVRMSLLLSPSMSPPIWRSPFDASYSYTLTCPLSVPAPLLKGAPTTQTAFWGLFGTEPTASAFRATAQPLLSPASSPTTACPLCAQELPVYWKRRACPTLLSTSVL